MDSDYDSDEELQRAFAEGRLKPGLNHLAPPKEKREKKINNVAGLQQKLDEFSQSGIAWIERMDVSVEPTKRLTTEEETNDDLKRELIFYNQAQAAVLQALPKLKKLGIVTKRPEDYYAEMAKSDTHMMKIREKLSEKKTSLERSEAAKKLREAKKLGKKIQTEVTLQRQKEKRDLQNAVKLHRKGKTNNLQEILDKSGGQPQPNKKRQLKNKKFGFGGQKKRSKRNDKKSFLEMVTGPNKKSKSKQKNQPRPGKSQRRKARNKKK